MFFSWNAFWYSSLHNGMYRACKMPGKRLQTRKLSGGLFLWTMTNILKSSKIFHNYKYCDKVCKKITCRNWQIFDSENFESKMKQPLFLSDWEQNLGGHDSCISSRSPKVFSKVWQLNNYWHDMILSWILLYYVLEKG